MFSTPWNLKFTSSIRFDIILTAEERVFDQVRFHDIAFTIKRFEKLVM